MVGTVVAAASVVAIARGAIVPEVATIIVDAVVPEVATIIVDTVVSCVMAHLMRALLMVGRIVAAATCLSDGRYGEGAGDGERCQCFRGAGVHVEIPPGGIAM